MGNEMTCKHAPGYHDGERFAAEREASKTPDVTRFEIIDIDEIGPNLVVKVKYPNCASCAFEGTKVLVYLDRRIKDVIKWRRIDPHFEQPKVALATEAPSPVARFPANAAGWADAIEYAQKKRSTVTR